MDEKLIRWAAWKLSKYAPDVDHEELVSYTSYIYAKCLKGYNPEKAKFSTYYMRSVFNSRGELLRPLPVVAGPPDMVSIKDEVPDVSWILKQLNKKQLKIITAWMQGKLRGTRQNKHEKVKRVIKNVRLRLNQQTENCVL